MEANFLGNGSKCQHEYYLFDWFIFYKPDIGHVAMDSKGIGAVALQNRPDLKWMLILIGKVSVAKHFFILNHLNYDKQD